MEGSKEQAAALFDQALQTLMPIGDLPRLAEVCRAKARVMAEDLSPDVIFSPVQAWIDEHPALLTRLAQAVAYGHYQSARGLHHDGGDWIETAAALHDLDEQLAPEEKTALRMHPWSRTSRAFG